MVLKEPVGEIDLSPSLVLLLDVSGQNAISETTDNGSLDLVPSRRESV